VTDEFDLDNPFADDVVSVLDSSKDCLDSVNVVSAFESIVESDAATSGLDTDVSSIESSMAFLSCSSNAFGRLE